MKNDVLNASNSRQTAGPVLFTARAETLCDDGDCERTCELCQKITANQQELQNHLRTDHTGFVDRLIISMCLAQAS